MLALYGCACDENEVRLLRTPTEHMINNGIKNYEDGNYSASIATLQSLVDNKSATNKEKVLAYKFLAFNFCISTTLSKDYRERMCRDSFQKAIDLNPFFTLSAAEAGHPIWGPVFSNVKNKPAK
jgi:hypothetical protein